MQKTPRPCAPHRRTLARRGSASAVSKKSPASRLLAAMATLALASSSALAANDLWIGNTDANFNTLSNWTGSANPNGNTPEFGAAGTSGTTLNNDQTGSSFAGILFDSGASAYTIGGNSFTLTANVTNNSTSTQTINNDITLSSTNHTFSGPLVLGGNIGGTINGSVTVTPGTGNSITLGGTNNFAFTTGTFLAALFNAGTTNITGSTTTDGGSVSNDGGFVVDANAGAGTTSTLTIASGGTFHVKGSTAGAANTTPNDIIGQQSGTGVLNVGATDKSTSGTFTLDAGNGLLIGNSGGNGTLNVNSGTATINRGTVATTTTLTDTRLIMMGKDNNSSTGTVNLNGGTLATDRQFVLDGSSAAGSGTANFVFNGGTLKALGTQTDWLQSTTASIAGQNQGAGTGTLNTNAKALSSVTTTAVSTIDSNGFSVAINNAISGVGGFNINSSTGSGTVTFGGAKSYSGGTTITAGKLNVSGSITGTGAVAVSGGTSATLGGSGSLAGAVTVTSGSRLAPGTITTASNFGSAGTLTLSSASGLTLTSANLDFDLSTTAGGTNDKIALGANALSFTTLNFSFSGTTLDTTTAYTLISTTNTTSPGTLANITTDFSAVTGGSYAATYSFLSGTGLQVSFTAVPEPHEFAIAIVALLGVMVFIRRRNQMS